MVGTIRLIISQGVQRGQSFALDGHDLVIIGAADDCQIRLHNTQGLISRHHCMLEVLPPLIRLRDLGSKNGTYINGEKTGGRGHGQDRITANIQRFPDIALKDRDEIRVGDVTLRVAIDASALQAQIKSCQRCQKPLDTLLIGDVLCPACREFVENDAATLRAILEADIVSPVPIVPNYTFDRRLGGGNSVVYLVRHRLSGMLFALKILVPKILPTASIQTAFQREIEQLKALRHANLVTLYEGSIGNQILCFLTEFCQIGSVEDLIRKRKYLSVSEATPIMRQSLAGLSALHQAQIVHHDLKPQNVLLGNDDGRYIAKIGDWGIVSNIERTGLSGLTITSNYASPLAFVPREQITQFKQVAPVNDVWSLSATFYYMLTGRYPRQARPGQTSIEVALTGESVPIREHRSDIPARLAAVIDRALQVETDQRYPDATAMRAAFIEAIGE